MSFFAELKRRNVFKVGAAYIIVGWLIMQGGEVMAPALNLPGWINSMLAFFLILGFPVAMIFAWAFEMTPDGIKKEKDVDRSLSITRNTGRKLDFSIIGLLAVALVYFIWEARFQPGDVNPVSPGVELADEQSGIQTGPDVSAETPRPQTHDKKSIAVLPFVNMSDDGANEYFSDGLSEELLNLLAKIPELKVAARTSSFQFKGKTGDIEAIAAQLKVANILEGSVRKSGNQVRITAQLIKADDGYHLWSETYDRTLENIFAIQDEIAAAVVNELKVTLLGEAVPTTLEADPEAYSFFLQGRYFYNQASEENSFKSVEAYQRAIDIDPDYAPALAGLALSTLHQAGQSWIELASGVAKAREAAEHSISLDPGLALGWVSLSRIQGEYVWDWNGANESMQMALKLEPNASYVLSTAGRLAGSLGELDKAVDYYQQASAVDPLNQRVLNALSGALETANLLQEAIDTERRLYALNPDYAGITATIAWLLLRQGDAEQALVEIGKNPDSFWEKLIRHLALHTLGSQAEADAELAAFVEEYHSWGAYQIAESYSWRDEPDEAFKWLYQAYDQHDPGLGSLLKDTTLRNLHTDPRWVALMEKMGLLDTWNAMPAKYKGVAQ